MSNRRGNYEENKYPSQHTSMDQQTPIVLYMNEKVKILEAENNELKREINAKTNDKEKIEYYLRLRREMLEQIENLKSENLAKDIHYRNEIEKLNETNSKLNEKLNERKNNEDEFINQTSPLKYFDKEAKSLFDTKSPGMEAKSKLNKTSKNNISDKKSKTKYFQNVIPDGNADFSYVDFKLTQHLKTNELILAQNNSTQRNNEEDKTQYNSAYITIIGDMEDKLNDYNRVIKLRDDEISNLKNELNGLRLSYQETQESLAREVEGWKQKYLMIFNNQKTLSNEFSEFHTKKDEVNKKELDKNLYTYQKKVLHLEKLCAKYESDLESISQQHANNDSQKQLEIENLKFNVKKLIENYDQINKTYEENLKALVVQIDNFKQLYLNREGEFMELTEYYCKAVEEYSKPLQTVGKRERVFELEDLFSKQTKEVENLKKDLDKYIKENTKLKNEIVEGKPVIRAKISEAMKGYETAIKEIKETHEILKTKLTCLEKFVTYFDEQFKFFNSVLDEKKKLEEYILNLECEIKMNDVQTKEEEILTLKEQNMKLSRELEIKENLVKEYEKIISNNNNSSVSDRKKSKEISQDILMKLNSEISILTNQIVGLNKSKESIESFYKTELKNCLDKLKEKSDKIEDLQNIISKLQHDFSAKKDNIFNLWLLEFKEFKENLLTMAEIKNVISKFHIEGEQMKINSDRIYAEELLMLRDEMKVKDDLLKDFKKNNEDEKSKLNKLIDLYKNTVNIKQSTYDGLINQKHMEIASLQNEKQALIQIDKKKQEICAKELKAWNEQKELLNTLVITQFESKDKEISQLKNHVEIIQKELNNTKENYQKDIDNVLKSVESQLALVKDRELFTVSQLNELEERYNSLKEEKDRITQLLKEENEELKNQNRMLSKLKSESSTPIQTKSTFSEVKK